MTVKTSILNGTNLNRDHDFSSIISGVEKTGVRTGFGNELAVTSGQVDTGMAFISVKRTTVTPNEVFTIPVWVTAPVTGLDTTTVGNFIIIEIDQAKINDGSSNAVDGSGIATVKSVAVLPTENFIELAEITTGPVITDKRSFATIKDDQVPTTYNWALDTGVADAYIVSIPSSPKAYFDGMRVRFKALNLNTGASTINVNGLGVVPITKNHDVVLGVGDIKANQNIEIVYNSDLVGFEMQSLLGEPGTSLIKANQAEAEAGVENTKYMTPLRAKQAIDQVVQVGSIMQTFDSSDPTGWLLLNGDSIGDTGSSATKKSATYINLFTFLWNNLADAQAAVSGGRGASAAADWAANKNITLPDGTGKTLVGIKSGTFATMGDASIGSETHPLTLSELAPHSHTYAFSNAAGGGPTHYSFLGNNINGTTSTVGSGTAHNNIQPSLVINHIIKI